MRTSKQLFCPKMFGWFESVITSSQFDDFEYFCSCETWNLQILHCSSTNQLDEFHIFSSIVTRFLK